MSAPPADALSHALSNVRARADALDQTGDWPADDLGDLATAGAMRWAVPADFGGADLSGLDLHLRYEQVAAASLAIALLLSQRDSAVGLIDAADDSPIRAELLPVLANNEQFTTVGIAQLTTSHQHSPAMRAERVAGGWRVDGLIPWSSGAGASEAIVAGATTEDRQQVLFHLPTRTPGVTVERPLPLVALRATWTGRVRCAGVFIEDRLVLRGPMVSVLAGRKRSLPLGQAFLAMGLCRGALDLIAEHRAPAAAKAHERLSVQLERVRGEVLALSSPGREAEATASAARVRGICNDLSVRISHAAVALYKGSALLAGHPAQRLAREAMFLLVWSCPDPVIDCTVEALTGGEMASGT